MIVTANTTTLRQNDQTVTKILIMTLIVLIELCLSGKHIAMNLS
uniref:Uncharacterized protein n=1 Tax=Anguilla anguilla TaxID=7936 RepID=A0A0E9R814_ANGAN